MQLLKAKREEFSINIRNQKREEIFKQKRLLKADDLPFTTLNNCSQIFYDAYHSANFLNNYEDLMILNILRIKELQELYSENECTENYDTSADVECIFDVFNKGFPKIDKACLEILLAFTLPNHNTCKPILGFIPELLQCYLKSPFNVLKSSIALIFLNLCADCYQCRDTILIYEIPQKMYYSMKTVTTELIEDLAQIIINIARIKPFITTYNQIQLLRLSIELFKHIQNEEYKIGILQFIQKVYQHDKFLMDTNFIITLLQSNQSQKYQLEILSLIRVLTLFDRPKYEESEQKIIQYLQIIIDSFNFESELDYTQSKIINKILSILTNLILENPQLFKLLTNSKIFNLFQWQNSKIIQNLEIYQKIYFYSFFLQITKILNNEEIKSMNKIMKPIEFLIHQIRNNEDDEDIILEILEIIEIILTKDLEQIQYFQDLNGIAYLSELSHHENTKIYTYCERIFDIIE